MRRARRKYNKFLQISVFFLIYSIIHVLSDQAIDQKGGKGSDETTKTFTPTKSSVKTNPETETKKEIVSEKTTSVPKVVTEVPEKKPEVTTIENKKSTDGPKDEPKTSTVETTVHPQESTSTTVATKHHRENCTRPAIEQVRDLVGKVKLGFFQFKSVKVLKLRGKSMERLDKD